MGLFRGGMTFSRFHVRGDLPAKFHDRYLEAIRLRAFRPLDPTEEVDERGGWCAPGDGFDLDPAYEAIFVGGYLNLGMRVDTWRIPRSLFKAAMRDAERSALSRSGEEKLSRTKKKELETFLKARLRKKVIPAMRVFDLTWNLDTGIVRFFSHAPKMQDHMVELFLKTFDLDLALDGMFLAASFDEALADEVAEALPLLEPLSLAVAG
ncbi:MAG: hypothetical protein R3B72_04260 [Polyangiaceae bacterium]